MLRKIKHTMYYFIKKNKYNFYIFKRLIVFNKHFFYITIIIFCIFIFIYLLFFIYFFARLYLAKKKKIAWNKTNQNKYKKCLPNTTINQRKQKHVTNQTGPMTDLTGLPRVGWLDIVNPNRLTWMGWPDNKPKQRPRTKTNLT
jgi:predicted membrane protein